MGDLPDRTPIALWRHFPIDDQTPSSLAAAIINFQRTYDFDLVKVTPASSFCLKDWGVEDIWRGSTEGTRDYVGRIINSPEDWTKLKPLNPKHGALQAQLSCLKLIISAGIKEIFYETSFNSGEKALVRDSFVNEGLVTIKQVQLSENIAKKAASFLLSSISVSDFANT